jgi:hypothetical protein
MLTGYGAAVRLVGRRNRDLLDAARAMTDAEDQLGQPVVTTELPSRKFTTRPN